MNKIKEEQEKINECPFIPLSEGCIALSLDVAERGSAMFDSLCQKNYEACPIYKARKIKQKIIEINKSSF